MLGKKSWNVYNQDNIEKVRRDEAIAKAKEEAAEERMQEADAARRLAILRGQTPEPLAVEEIQSEDQPHEARPQRDEREKRKRKRYGEDDTDFEMRVANERTKTANTETQMILRTPLEVPLTDSKGHIDLFPQERPKHVEKNAEAEREAAKKKKEYEDQYMMKFSNAAGFKQGIEDPWYSRGGAETEQSQSQVPSKDVWGNEDLRRPDREAARVVQNDPLAMMRQGAAQVRKVERERRSWLEEREKETAELEKTERKRRKRSHRSRDEEELEGFRLDEPVKKSRSDDGSRKSRHHHSHRHSSRKHRSRSRDRGHSREIQRSKY